MADSRITELNGGVPFAGTVAADDVLAFVDVSDTTDHSTGSSFPIEIQKLPFASTAQGSAADSAVQSTLFNAHTVLAATFDNTPAALTVAEETLVGRITAGNIAALTAIQVRALLNVENGADVTDTANVTAAGALMDSEVDADIKTLVLPASTTISTWGRTLVDDADAATARGTLGLGTAATLNVDADLATFVLPASTTISTYGRTLVDDVDAATARGTLGLGSAATTASTAYQAADSELAAIAGLTSAADRLPYFTGSGTASLATFTSAGRTLVAGADATAQRATLGLGTAATTASTAYATAAQGTLAGTALQPAAIGTTVEPYLAVSAVEYTLTTDTLALTDAGQLLYYSNAGLVTVTVPTNATVAFPIGTRMVLMSTGAGGLTLLTTGLTLLGTAPLVTIAINEALYLEKIAINTWAVLGGTA